MVGARTVAETVHSFYDKYSLIRTYLAYVLLTTNALPFRILPLNDFVLLCIGAAMPPQLFIIIIITVLGFVLHHKIQKQEISKISIKVFSE